ncbi:hypothetical protein B484DRAFT_432008, partial [Ochromonadaceae sp. CCMP2298]
PSIDATLKRKIEAIVRRRYTQGEEAAEATLACPISGQMIAATSLECPTTRDALPMCVVTGRHMVLDDWCFCPTSKFPALYSEYVKYIEGELASQSAEREAKEGAGGSPIAIGNGSPTSNISHALTVPDPVLGKNVSLSDLALATPEEATAYIQKYNNVEKKKEEGGVKTEETGGTGTETGGSGEGTGAEEGKKKASKGKIDRVRRQKHKNKH